MLNPVIPYIYSTKIGYFISQIPIKNDPTEEYQKSIEEFYGFDTKEDHEYSSNTYFVIYI